MPLLSDAIAIGTGTVLVLITVVVAPIAAIAFARSGSAWEQIGRGPLAIEPQVPSADEERAPPPGDPALRAEVRELVLAANERRARAGEPALEVEVETDRRLTASSPASFAGIS